MELCKYCGDPIEKILDPWGYDSYRGTLYGYFHSLRMDQCEGDQTLAGYCDASKETFAEPRPTIQQAIEQLLDSMNRRYCEANGITKAVKP
jgi:hypothetical protein